MSICLTLVSSSECVGSSASIDVHAPLTLYTSGSSGAPKPIHKTLAQFNAEVHTLEAQWGALVGDATVLGSVPHHHIYGLLFRVFWPLAAGRAFDRALSMEPQHLQARIAQCGPGSAPSWYPRRRNCRAGLN
jgi:acyl-coenzyme A synthetase/AMP-(fatty) acid ligase